MIQSTKPASISGMSELIPSPAGVIAPVSVMPTRDVGLQHPPGEELAPLAQPTRVVGQEGVVDEVGGRLPPVDGRRIDALALEVLVRWAAHPFSRSLSAGFFRRCLRPRCAPLPPDRR